MLNHLAKSLFDAYGKAIRDKREDWRYKELDETPYLFSTDYLDDLYEKAEYKEDFETILDHMYRHDATEVDSYSKLEDKIIDKFWK